MNVRCPNCQSVFRVDPARVPPTGIRAKCSRCGKPFVLKPPASRSAPGPSAAQPQPTAPSAPAVPGGQGSQPPAAPTPASPASMTARPEPPPTAHAQPAPQPAPPAAPPKPPVAEPPVAEPSPAAPPRPGATVQAGIPVFGSKDPDARARRIARALVSDIVAYNRPKVERALAAGTMRTEFREEIMKSWEEYAAQVGAERARHTPHFRDALNEILASGQRIF